MKEETLLETEARIMGVCKIATYCFLNCHGCYRIKLANATELKQAAKDLREHRKKKT